MSTDASSLWRIRSAQTRTYVFRPASARITRLRAYCSAHARSAPAYLRETFGILNAIPPSGRYTMDKNSSLISASGQRSGGASASTAASGRPDLATARKALRARLIEARRACSTTIHEIDAAIRAINLRTRPSLPLGEALRAIDELEREALVSLPIKGPAIKACHVKAGDVCNEP